MSRVLVVEVACNLCGCALPGREDAEPRKVRVDNILRHIDVCDRCAVLVDDLKRALVEKGDEIPHELLCEACGKRFPGVGARSNRTQHEKKDCPVLAVQTGRVAAMGEAKKKGRPKVAAAQAESARVLAKDDRGELAALRQERAARAMPPKPDIEQEPLPIDTQNPDRCPECWKHGFEWRVDHEKLAVSKLPNDSVYRRLNLHRQARHRIKSENDTGRPTRQQRKKTGRKASAGDR